MADLRRTNTIVIRQPKILETFARLWGTDDIIASFDGINISQPINKETGRIDVKPTDAWPRKTSRDITILLGNLAYCCG